MKEFVTHALVLRVERSREYDRVATLFTKDLGRVRVKVTSGARLLSKFAPHLDPLNLVRVRLAHKNGYTLTDVLTEERFAAMRKDSARFGRALRAAALVLALSAEGEPDLRIWHELVRALTDDALVLRSLLAYFGYDVAHASCERCGANPAPQFAVPLHALLCMGCAATLPEHALLLIGE